MEYPKIGVTIAKESKQALPVSTSKIGGMPSLPHDFAWPVNHISEEPLGFVFQINFEELQQAVPNKVLPTKGLLQFYCSLDETDLSNASPEHAFVFHRAAEDLSDSVFPEGINESEADLSERHIIFTTDETEGAYLLGEMPEFNAPELNELFNAKSYVCLMELDAYEFVSRKGAAHSSVFGAAYFTFPIEKQYLEAGTLEKTDFVKEG